MSLLSTVEKYNKRLITFLEWIGSVGLLTMVFITCVDVLGSKAFLWPIFGALDIVQLSQLVAISFGASSALILGRHVEVEFFTVMFPERAQAAISAVVNFLGLLLFIIVLWRIVIFGNYMLTGGEVSSTARIPFYPFAYGIALGSLPVCLVLLSRFITSLSRMLKK
jgi:TRAP-type C4-dicarboxylate transport system permease small subunit